jgi:hypothetical protein
VNKEDIHLDLRRNRTPRALQLKVLVTTRSQLGA